RRPASARGGAVEEVRCPRHRHAHARDERCAPRARDPRRRSRAARHRRDRLYRRGRSAGRARRGPARRTAQARAHSPFARAAPQCPARRPRRAGRGRPRPGGQPGRGVARPGLLRRDCAFGRRDGKARRRETVRSAGRHPRQGRKRRRGAADRLAAKPGPAGARHDRLSRLQARGGGHSRLREAFPHRQAARRHRGGPRGPPMTTHRARVLLVDDNEALVENLASILDDEGYEVRTAPTGAKALAAARPGFDVALLDVRLPDADGTELAEKLREISPEGAIVLLTGFATLETAIAAVRAGAFAYLVKPCSTPDLLLTIEQALRQVRLHAEKRELSRGAQVAERLATVRTMTAGLSPGIR